jgi:hypothetical protein
LFEQLRPKLTLVGVEYRDKSPRQSEHTGIGWQERQLPQFGACEVSRSAFMLDLVVVLVKLVLVRIDVDMPLNDIQYAS